MIENTDRILHFYKKKKYYFLLFISGDMLTFFSTIYNIVIESEYFFWKFQRLNLIA